MAGDTHYDVLGVAPTCDVATARKAYVGLARQYHPDFYADSTPAQRAHAEAKMREINEAWKVLGSATDRSKYDKHLVSSGRLTTSGAPTSGARRVKTSAHAEERASGTAPPRWLTMLPALCLFLSVGCFAVGMVTGALALLAGAVGFAVLGAAMFVVVPLIALKRSKRGSVPQGGSAVRA